MRLQKFMAKCGVASRRKSEEIISQNRVKVNGTTMNEPGTKINTNEDTVTVDDRQIKLEENKIYILLNKPTGYITTTSDEFDRKKVTDLIGDLQERVYPIGRLDYDTSGLLLLTNDGDLAYKLTHPKYEIEKKYIAKVEGRPSEEKLTQFRNGLEIENYITARAKIKIISKEKGYSRLEIVIHEGKNRQVRKMCSKIGHPVIELKRIEMDEIKLGDIIEGKWRYLTSKEVLYLKNSI